MICPIGTGKQEGELKVVGEQTGARSDEVVPVWAVLVFRKTRRPHFVRPATYQATLNDFVR